MALASVLLVAGCDSGSDDPCARWFEPYPDLVTGRVRSGANASLLDGMALYGKKDYAGAVVELQAHARARPDDADAAWFYSAQCYLALGRPYDAELQLDFLERWHGKTFRDETEWYSALCLLCSGQNDRARAALEAIAARPKHTYGERAREASKGLSP